MNANKDFSRPLSNLTKDQEVNKVLFDYAESMATLTPEEKQAIQDSIQIKEFKKGTFLLMEGDTLYMCYFIIKGCVREYYIKDGEERTTNFFVEQEAISSMNGNSKKTPSKYFLECLEDIIVTTSSEEKEQEMFKQFPKFESMCRIKMEEMVGEYQEKLARYITSSPEERYRHLQENRPRLLDRVPQYQLASYIGVKPETLSRIRKRMAMKK
ncbi:MAG: Crp/Fnr family transcriptional regulator [Saprospiraceae bacterium]